ncbi:MAG: beta strand repeat-containing protein, partial [Flavobacterium sp.]|uniref:beta strand repeat-containing protein n=1 Tax=Flavobacterium sp. TaxID=239 RepID=UPI003BBFDCE7
MKTKFYSLLLFLFCLSITGYAQTGIGAYSVHDGGFENHTTTLAGGNASNAALSSSLWTASTTSNVVRVLNSTGGRSGPKYVSLGSTSGTLKNFYSPQIAGAFASNTTYQIQFWYKTASTTALDASTVDLFVDNTSATQAPPIGIKQSVAAGLSTSISNWTKVAVSITTNATVVGNFGVAGFTIDAASAGYSADFDDFVIYQANSPDITAPNSPGAITASGASNGGANVSWNAATGGVDGGGYVVVRFASTVPSATDDPNQNGIYKFNNSIGAGVVRYIGTSTSFTDTSLSPGVDYYYKVYSVDKAFNYSMESTTSSPVQALATTYYYKGTGLLTDVANWGLNTNGTGTSPTNFVDASQVFEIRNTTAVSLDGTWTVGADPANGTKVRLGNTDQAPIILTLNSGASIGPAGTGNLDVMVPSSGNQTVIYKGTTALSFGNIFDTNLEVIYDGVTVSSATTKSFGTVSLLNAANVTFTATPVIKNLTVDESSILVAPTSASSYIIIPTGGLVSINGTVKVPKLTGFVSSGETPSSNGADIQFVGTENLTLGANSTVEYVRVAASAQTVTARSDYRNLTLSGSTPKNINGPTIVSGTFTVNQTAPATAVTLNSDLTINGTLSFVSGKITTVSNTLTIGNSGSITGAGLTSGWVVGNLKKQTASGASPTFNYAIGDSNNYTPLALTFSGNTTAAGSIRASSTSGDHAAIASSYFNGSKSVNRTWTLTNDALVDFGTYSADFNYTSGDNDANVSLANFKVGLYSSAVWSYFTTSNVTATTATATGISGFGDFAIGEYISAPIASSQIFCAPATVANLVATGTAIQWYAAATGGDALAPDVALASGNYYASQTLNGSESARTAVAVTIQAAPNAGTNGSLIICAGTSVSESSLFAALGGTPATGGTWSATTGGAGTYTYTQAATSPCTTPNTATVTVTIQAAPNAGTNGTLSLI